MRPVVLSSWVAACSVVEARSLHVLKRRREPACQRYRYDSQYTLVGNEEMTFVCMPAISVRAKEIRN